MSLPRNPLASILSSCIIGSRFPLSCALGLLLTFTGGRERERSASPFRCANCKVLMLMILARYPCVSRRQASSGSSRAEQVLASREKERNVPSCDGRLSRTLTVKQAREEERERRSLPLFFLTRGAVSFVSRRISVSSPSESRMRQTLAHSVPRCTRHSVCVCQGIKKKRNPGSKRRTDGC